MVSVQLFDVRRVPGPQAAPDRAGIPARVMVPSASRPVHSMPRCIPADQLGRSGTGVGSSTFPTGAHGGAGRAMLGSGQVREGARRLGR
ncbi:hypothetical protein GCM10010521_70230 [Streptomyces rameus]|uniref:Uncharacterized protein n=1 Tax=Streptomyces rameus TaxID=68261 RepID=A0ABN3V9B0_9ACTN